MPNEVSHLRQTGCFTRSGMRAAIAALALIASASCAMAQNPQNPDRAQARTVYPGLTLWYDHPPTTGTDAVLTNNGAWPEALLIGNGRMGGQVWGGIADERIDLNEDTLWTGEPSLAINPNAAAAMKQIRELLLAGDNLKAQTIYQQSIGAAGGGGSSIYMPLGELHMNFPRIAPGQVAKYRRELDLDTAVARITFESEGVVYTREVFASHPAEAIFVRLTASQPGKISFAAKLTSQLRNQVKATDGYLTMTGRAPNRSSSFSGTPRAPVYDPARGMFWESRLVGASAGGHLSYTDQGLVATGCDSVTLALVARTSYNGPAKSPSTQGLDPSTLCADDLKRTASKDYQALRDAHIADYQNLFHRVRLDLGHAPTPAQGPSVEALPTDERIKRYQPGTDPALAALYYQFGRYLLISASRPGGQPCNLQGLWNSNVNPPWGCNWTINCNAEINYWPVEAANLAECHEPLINMIQELSVNGERVAREVYGARGWMAHHATDLWKSSAPAGGNPQWSAFVDGGSWFSEHLWEHFAFSGDTDYLRRIWPTLKGAALFHLDMLVEEPKHKWLVMNPDINFENQWLKPDGTKGSLCIGATPTMQIIRELFTNCILASKILGEDADFRAELEKALPRLAPMQISPTTGQLQEYLDDWAHTAKAQVLSSWGAVVGSQINPRTTPEFAAGLKKIYDTERWWEDKADPKMGPCLGSWEGAFQTNAYARLLDGDAALLILDRHLQKAVQPNLGSNFLGHPPAPSPGMFQIDGNLGQTSAINEMLLQSQLRDANGIFEIELLPALPKGWPEGEVHGLRARGAFEVDITWKSGKLTAARITSLKGAKTTLRYGDTVLPLQLTAGAQRDFTAADFKK
jgi:alpha-L-fucosidase 2